MSLKTIETKIQKILQDGQVKADELTARIETIQQTEQEAAEAFLKAKAAGDPEAYSKAAANQRSAKDIREMYGDKLTALKNAPLISEDEYKSMVNETMAELEQLNTTAKAEAAKHLEALNNIGQELTEVINFGNELLHQVQHDLFKDTAGLKLANGTVIPHHSFDKQYKDYSVASSIRRVIETMNHLYKEDK